MKSFCVVVLLGLTGCVLTSSDTPEAKSNGSDRVQPTDAHLRSLSYVFYDGNPMPPMPTAAEIQVAKDAVAAYIATDRYADRDYEDPADYLERFFGDSGVHLALAMRDSDGDGVRDYRLNLYFGMFYEGDADIDGDGLSNVLDPAPYLASEPLAEDRERILGGDLPAHLRLPDAAAAEVQEALYEKYRIALAAQGALFSYDWAKSIADSLQIGFGSWLETKGNRFDGLEVVALRPFDVPRTAENLAKYAATYPPGYAHGPDEDPRWAGESKGGLYQPSSETIYIFDNPYGTQLGRLDQLSLMIHEIAHAFQASFDIDAQRAYIQLGYDYYPRLWEYVRQFGWETEANEAVLSRTPSPLFSELEASRGGPRQTFLGWQGSQWSSWYDGLGLDFFENDLDDYFLPGTYSYASLWEWHAEHVASLALAALRDEVRTRCTDESAELVINAWYEYNMAKWNFRFQAVDDQPEGAASVTSGPCVQNDSTLCQRIKAGSNPFAVEVHEDLPVNAAAFADSFDHYIEGTLFTQGVCQLRSAP